MDKKNKAESIRLTSGQFLQPELAFAVLRRAPQPEYPLHSHEFDELVIVYEGSGNHFTPEHNESIHAGHVYVVPAGRKHGYSKVNNLKLVNIAFDLHSLDSPLSELQLFPSFQLLFKLNISERSSFRLSQDKLRNAMLQVARIEEEVAGELPAKKIMTAALFMELIALLIRAFEVKLGEQSHLQTGIGKVISYLHHYLSQDITVGEMAQMANMPESSFNRAFKKATGRAPAAYRLQLRLRYAKAMQQNPDLKIMDIAAKVGIQDSNYFSRVFKAVYAQTPREYRIANLSPQQS
ncbi:MAG: helix-turn-helix domain-containing protein [Lentisphaerae bacterium]|nr:helix-turn-helix domain-containing protein [Lentisphaerota bacterium]MCP4101482.1 helix-turn-helix domain-containing protein [Lentisphaerota bacterium]